jgi:hypothetical protein
VANLKQCQNSNSTKAEETTMMCNQISVENLKDKVTIALNESRTSQRIELDVSGYARKDIDFLIANETENKSLAGIIFASEDVDRLSSPKDIDAKNILRINDNVEKLKLLTESLNEAFNGRMNFLTEKEKSEFMSFTKASSDEGFLYRINDGQEMLGLIFLQNFERPNIGQVILENWVWSKPNLNDLERNLFYSNVEVLLRTFKGRIVDESTTGFAASIEKLESGAEIKHALYECLERFILNAILDRQNLPLKEWTEFAAKTVVNKLPVINTNPGFLKVYVLELPHLKKAYPQIFDSNIDGYFVWVLYFREGKGVVPGSACGFNLEATIERAYLEMYLHITALNQIDNDISQLGDSIIDRRLFNFGTNPDSIPQILKVIETNQNKSIRDFEYPEIIFSRALKGSWEPEVKIHRIILEGQVSFISGNLGRFIF